MKFTLSTRVGRQLRPAFLSVMLGMLFTFHVSAQSAAAEGAITGRVLNPASGEYLRNAQIRIESTGQTVSSEAGGYYRIAPIAPGPVTLVVNYTGYRPVTTIVQVAAGGTVTRDFELISSLNESTTADPGAPIKLSAFTVSSAREGNAKAIMNQRNSMNVVNSVASDVFGDVAEGNVGEFLKHMPGVVLNLVEGEARTVSLRGLGAEYTAVTLDGVSLANADANTGAAGNARAFGFEQVSLSSMESIEVSKTVSADVDANAPAGTINLKTKRAFDRAGRSISWQTNVTAFHREFTLDRTPGPSDQPSRKILPGAIFEYSDVFLNQRLGLVFNLSESNVYSEITHTTSAYDQNPTAADPRQAVVTQLSTFHGPRTNRRSTVTFSSDFKATPHLVLSLGFIYNKSDLWFFFRNLTLNSGARTGVIGADPLINFTSTAAGSVVVNPIAVAKLGTTYTYTPRFEYKKGNLQIEGRFAASDSESTYEPQQRRASFFQLGSPTANGVTFAAQRSSLTSAAWQVRQVAGPDIGSGASFTSPTIFTQDGRYAGVKIYSADIAASLATKKLGIPIVWKAGVKTAREIRDFDITRESFLYNYTGPGAGLGAWAALRSPFDFDFGAVGASLVSSSNSKVFYPNLLAATQLFRDRPEYFTRSLTATNYYNANVANKKHYEEDIDAAFLMGTATVGKVIVRGGLRREETSSDAREVDPRSAAEVRAAGHAIAAGRATTIPGLQYQYFSQPQVHRTGSYSNYFPSASLKYKFNRALDFHFGYSSTIRRPTFRDVAGVWVVNDENTSVAAPNSNLEPETSNNFSARLAYYFEPVGTFAVNFFQNNVEKLHLTNSLTAEEFGNTDPELASYRFNTTTNSAREVIVRGMELEYSQSLSFLPRPFNGLNARASYTRNYADVTVPGMAPHAASAGLNYSYNRANAWTNLNWSDDQTTNVTRTQYVRHRINVDAGGSLRLTKRVSLFLSVRNIFNEPYISMLILKNGVSVSQKYEIFGTNYTLGLKGTF
jgi:TonB-dependent receptor